MKYISAIEKTMSKFAFRQSVWEKAFASLPKQSMIDQAMKSISSQQAVIDQTLKSFASKQSVIDQTLKSFASQQSIWEKAMASIPKQSVINQTLKSFAYQQSIWEKAVASIPKQSVIDQTLKSFASQQSIWEKAISSIPAQSIIDQAINSIQTQQSVWARTNDYLKKQSLIEQSNCLAKMAKSIAQTNFEEEIYSKDFTDLDRTNSIIVDSTNELCDTNDPESFLSIFQKLPPKIQAIFYFICFQIIFSQLNSISANILTPKIESYLNINNAPTREKINTIKKIPLSIEGIETNNIRFITGDNVRLRRKPSTSSEILDEMVLGQIFTVVSKKRNWIQGSFAYENGETMSGWVFTRYTKKFTHYK